MKTAAQPEFELSTELLNQRLEGYLVLREVGHGAMGIVFEARQRGLERRVAVKVLPLNLSLRDRTVRRFLREAEAMGRLAHANIVDVYEVGSRGSLHYFAMRFVDGPPLDSVLKAGALAIDDVVQVGIDVASALAHAHSRGVLHRDVKPSNLLRDGERVVLTDFGLAKATDTTEAGAMTESGDLVGTPLYMSPEQILGDSDGVDARSDVWGLGATLYELLAARPPFSGTSAQSILHGILHRDPPLLHKLRADVPRDLEAVVLKCLEKDRNRRYSGAAGLHADLLAIQAGQPVSARPPRFFDPAVRWSRRHPYQLVTLLVAFLLVGFFFAQLRSSGRDLASTKHDLKQMDSKRAQVSEEKMLAIAKSEMLEAVKEWGDTNDPAIRLHAFDRVGHLMQAISIESYPQTSVEIMRVYATFAHESGQSQQLMEFFDSQFGNSTSAVALAMRGAMLEGLRRFPEALAVHQQRASIAPRASEPWLDAAGVLFKLALLERAAGNTQSGNRKLGQAIDMHAQALARAIRAADGNATATILIERARCLCELGQMVLAEKDLRQALVHDAARADALALLEACKAVPDSVADLPSEDSVVGIPGGGPGGEAPRAPAARNREISPLQIGLAGLPLVDHVPTALDVDRQDLAEAGKSLQEIYRGLRGVLRTAASGVRPGEESVEPPAEEGEEP